MTLLSRLFRKQLRPRNGVPGQVQRADDLTLFHFPGCPYCGRVEAAISRLGLQLERHNILSDVDSQAELIREGGKRQVPCLRIRHPESGDEWLYESSSIIQYLNSRFSAG